MSNNYSGLRHELYGNQANRTLAAQNQKYGGDQASYANAAAMANADAYQKAGIASGVMSGMMSKGGASKGAAAPQQQQQQSPQQQQPMVNQSYQQPQGYNPYQSRNPYANS